jgi:arylsulfatase A-like enzyme
VVFEAAIVHASWTKPSVASLFTSTLPGRHRAVQLRDRLDPGLVTLAEMLQTRGYATGAAIANSVIYSAGSHFEQGFDFFAGLHGADDRPSKLVEAAGVVDTALEWIETRRGLPTFLYVHTMDPHVPYAPPPPFDRMFEPHPTADHPGVDPRYDYKEPLDRARLVAQYDGAIAYGDQEFGRFLEELKDRGLYDEALIIFLADHGEEFLDHGQWLHGRSVFDELIRVPLVVRFPGGRDGGRRVTQQVQAVDILPTILENEGLPVPPPPIISGRPLQRVVAGGAPEPTAVSEISHRGIVAHAIRTHRDKYVRSFSPVEDEMYFDLQDDPEELENRIDEAPERAASLKAAVEAAMVPNPFRHTLRLAGRGVYELSLKTGGWIEGVEVKGFGSADSHWLGASGRRLALQVHPRPGQPREVAFSIRPRGAPVRLEGTRDGRPLQVADVLIAREAVHPAEIPFFLPEIESESERVENIFTAPPAGLPGVHVWLALAPGRHVMELDAATRERLKALGYLDN